nr:MAG TPA: hypothetical protein [Caudoviricetes sp.]
MLDARTLVCEVSLKNADAFFHFFFTNKIL